MNQLNNLSTAVLSSMIKASSSYYRNMSEAELIDCKMTIALLQKEIDSRKLPPTAAAISSSVIDPTSLQDSMLKSTPLLAELQLRMRLNS